jgi:hypothetical protein
VDRGWTGYHDDVDPALYELCGEGRISIRVTFRPTILDRHGLPFDPAQFVQAFKKRHPLRGH